MKKKLLIIAAGLVVFACAFIAWRRYVEFVPPDATPAVALPSPNAYDFYVKAGKAAVPAPSNLDPVYDSKRIPEDQWKTHYPIAKKEEWLRKNSKSLQLLREGFKHPYRTPLRSQSSPDSFPFYASMREMARKLSVESRVYGEKERWGQAASSAMDSVRLGYDLSQGGVTLDYLVGAAINAIGRRTLWETVPHLNAVEARTTAQRLESTLAKHASLSDILRETKQLTLREYRYFMRSSEWPTMNLNNATGPARWQQLWQIYSTPRRTILNNYDQYMNAVIVVADKPYNLFQEWPSPPTDYYHQPLSKLNVYPNAHFLYAKEQAADALLLTSLALRAYRLDNGHYPQTLNELVPRYLKKNPADPFGNNKPLRYQPKADSYVLYSLGPDGIDNQGQKIRNPKHAGKEWQEFMVQRESKGDFLAETHY